MNIEYHSSYLTNNLISISLSNLVFPFPFLNLSKKCKNEFQFVCSVSTFATALMPHFDFFVVGAGSGGVSCARRAASYGAKVGIAEGKRTGGTCVNVGCVPKKIMFNAAFVHETLETASHFGFKVDGFEHDWAALKESRDKYILRLNNIYKNNLAGSNVVTFEEWATFTGPNSLKVGNEEITADHILIAVGGKPSKLNIPGEDLHGVINSDGFFELPDRPKKVAVIGAGYIAVELAGVLGSLGSDTHLFVRGNTALRKFEDVCRDMVHNTFPKIGVTVHSNCKPIGITQQTGSASEHPQFGINANKLSLKVNHSGAEEDFSDFDSIIVAVGREPELAALGPSIAGIQMLSSGHITVDEYQNTSTKGVYAIGDVCGKVELTPMAIAAGRRLADRLFGGPQHAKAKADYDNVPTVIFSHPPIGTIGLTEEEAIEKYGKDNLKVYKSTWVNLWYGQWQIDPPTKPKSVCKLITLLPDEKVVGLHVVGMASDEVLQGFGVAIRMGATKADLDNCVAIHPTAAEEICTLPPWGLAPCKKGANL